MNLSQQSNMFWEILFIKDGMDHTCFNLHEIIICIKVPNRVIWCIRYHIIHTGIKCDADIYIMSLRD